MDAALETCGQLTCRFAEEGFKNLTNLESSENASFPAAAPRHERRRRRVRV